MSEAVTREPRRGVNEQTGEVECASCVEAESELKAALHTLDQTEIKLKGAERDLNSWRVRFEELRRDKEAEAREHELWDAALDLFDLWRKATARAAGRKKPSRAKFSGDRFYLVLPFIKRYSVEDCQRAIIGRAFDHFTDERKNGSTIHYFEWERIFGSMGQGKTADANFTESANRAPKDWRQRVEKLMNDEPKG